MLEELADHTVPLEILQKDVADSSELDVYDLVGHVAFDQKPFTRHEHANNVKKRDVFGKYGKLPRGIFGSVEQYAQAVQELEQALYDQMN
nr:type I restriction-modification enzyme R subunit C-terminal domain-containing protein [Pseudomonas syringae]